jgi:hypothetical protein
MIGGTGTTIVAGIVTTDAIMRTCITRCGTATDKNRSYPRVTGVGPN